jgi:hypothetical protein
LTGAVLTNCPTLFSSEERRRRPAECQAAEPGAPQRVPARQPNLKGGMRPMAKKKKAAKKAKKR